VVGCVVVLCGLAVPKEIVARGKVIKNLAMGFILMVFFGNVSVLLFPLSK
jgi:hypothetical protein